MNLPAAIVVWVVIVATTAVAGVHLGFGGRRFAVALGVAAVLFAFEFWLAAPAVLARARDWLGGRGRALAPIVPLFAVILYSFAVTGNWRWMLAGAAYAVIPSLLLATSAGKAPGTWKDYAAAIFIWAAVWPTPPYRLLYHIFPYPPPLMHTLSILMALSTGVAAYVLLRRLDGIGYAFEWKRGFGWNFAFHFVVLAAIAIPLGLAIRFLTFAPTLARLRSFPVAAIGILLFTAWPEEFLFRGVLQNCLSRTFKNQWAGLIVASVIFGFSHILHSPAPNWRYVLLATIAGLFYGRTWMKTGSLLPGTLVHALIDLSWHILFK
ncbi:MAG TPA: type II CAAX endopeptidase family protein [Candidatus Acidoferrales bacterium]|nr:type II CAAX endopeptidase family protein [Candidatus Acidoferrales bacterium]